MKKLTIKKIVLTSVLSSMISIALANSHYYLGTDAGYSDTHYHNAQLGGDDGTTGFGYRLFGGYTVNPYFSVELGWADYAKASGNVTRSVTEHAYDTSAVGRYPLGSGGVSIFGKLGLAYIQAEKDFSGAGHAYANKIRPAYGMGLENILTPQLSVTLQWWRVQGKEDAFNGINVDTKLPNADLYSVGLIYRFL